MFEKKTNEIKLRSLTEARRLAKSSNSPTEQFRPIQLTSLKEARTVAKSAIIRQSSALSLPEKLFPGSPGEELKFRNIFSVSPEENLEFSDNENFEKEGRENFEIERREGLEKEGRGSEYTENIFFASGTGSGNFSDLEMDSANLLGNGFQTSEDEGNRKNNERISECSEKKEDDSEKKQTSIEKTQDLAESSLQSDNPFESAQPQLGLLSSTTKVIENELQSNGEESLKQSNQTKSPEINKPVENKSQSRLGGYKKKEVITPRKHASQKKVSKSTTKINQLNIKPVQKKTKDKIFKNEATVLEFIEDQKGDKKLSKSQERTLLGRLQGTHFKPSK